MKVTVKVTANDIARGKQGDPHSCPIARAIRRTMKFKTVIVTDNYAITGNDREFKCELPEIAKDFVFWFDEGKKNVVPRTFVLNMKAW